MSADEFWHGPYDLAVAYRKAYRIKRDMEGAAEWRLGIYFRQALAEVFDQSFSKGKGGAKYFEHPLTMSEKEAEAADEQRRRFDMERQKKIFRAKMEQLNARFRSSEQG